MVGLVMVLGVGCAGEPPEAGGAAFRREVNTEANLGSLVVSLDRTAITTADVLHLELVAVGPLNTVRGFPVTATKWGKWTVVDVSQVERSVLAGGKVRSRRVYTLEPYLAGDYVIPEFEVSFVELGKEAEVCLVEAIPVVVASVIEGDPEEADLVKPYADMEMDGDGASWWWWAGGGIGGVAVIAVLVWVMVRGRRAEETKEPSKREIAVGELDVLLGRDRVDMERLSVLAGRTPGVPAELVGRIEMMAFSKSGTDEAAARGVAEELRTVLAKEKGGER